MAERRMFAKTIIDSDAFLDMPVTSQLLYFHLCMRADDEGFINKPKSIMRTAGCKEDDLKLLFVKKFIIPFESGIVVIKHWKIHNYIRNDRLHETKYLDEKARLKVTDNQSYTICQSIDGQLTDSCQPNDDKMDTEVRLGKVRLGKVSLDIDKPPSPKSKYGCFNNVLLSDDEIEKLKEKVTDYIDYIERMSEYIESTGKKYKSHYAAILSWKRREKNQTSKQTVKTNKFNNFPQRDNDVDEIERKLLSRKDN